MKNIEQPTLKSFDIDFKANEHMYILGYPGHCNLPLKALKALTWISRLLYIYLHS